MQEEIQESLGPAEPSERGWWGESAVTFRRLRGIRWLRCVFWCVAGLTAGWVASSIWPEHYTSVASIRLMPGAIPQELLPRESANTDTRRASEMTKVLSTNVIANIINTFDLYPKRRDGSMDEMVNEFRNSMRVERQDPLTFRLSFTYANPFQAQSVVRDWVSKLIDESIRSESLAAFARVEFFKDEAEAAGKAWSKVNETLKATAQSNPQYGLLTIESAQARAQYESLLQKRAAAQLLQDMTDRKQGVVLELLDPATLPAEPDTAPWAFWLVGMGFGAVVWVFSEWRRSRLR